MNENIQLTPIHEIFFRDHEHWVDVLREKTGNSWTEDKYFETAKSIVESEYQRVIFDEFIDALAARCPARPRTASTAIIRVSMRRSRKSSPMRSTASVTR